VTGEVDDFISYVRIHIAIFAIFGGRPSFTVFVKSPDLNIK